MKVFIVCEWTSNEGMHSLHVCGTLEKAKDKLKEIATEKNGTVINDGMYCKFKYDYEFIEIEEYNVI